MASYLTPDPNSEYLFGTTGAFTVSAWVNPRMTSGYGTIVAEIGPSACAARTARPPPTGWIARGRETAFQAPGSRDGQRPEDRSCHALPPAGQNTLVSERRSHDDVLEIRG